MISYSKLLSDTVIQIMTVFINNAIKWLIMESKVGHRICCFFLMLWATNPAVEIGLIKFIFSVFLLCCMSLLSIPELSNLKVIHYVSLALLSNGIYDIPNILEYVLIVC